MFVYFTTVRRKRSVKEGGELIQLNWEDKQLIQSIPLFPSDPDIIYDPNPRGNSRGGKGVIKYNNELLVGTYHTILVFDCNLRFKRKISNNLFVNIHEMDIVGEHIWVSSTGIDCVLLVDLNGNTLQSWWPREIPLLQNTFGLSPMNIDKACDNRIRYLHGEMSNRDSHVHLNCVTNCREKTYILLNKLGVFVQIRPELKLIIHDKNIRGAHSARILDNGEVVVFCGSFKKRLLFYALKDGVLIKEIELLKFPEIKQLYKNYPDQPYNKSIFVRGLDIINNRRLLLGISPASIIEIDIVHEMLVDFFQYSTDVGDAVHGLAHIY
ncbi:hypothetical protein CSB45_09695 [candidate division KSB3 bacterium]|uniref:Uncharacterized protein n=1 Tax=candidate division KSB3 bacterium TaxID=2044937 RepID=A0A2G6E4C3_9BACT|nr:MAG: hypothetical protein CSB45_09695 [candidate division KSB3 bacterium]PIE29411.1 MAG: hypothetical protein CSA57_08380 [candidate division KSB3 bacterium]